MRIVVCDREEQSRVRLAGYIQNTLDAWRRKVAVEYCAGLEPLTATASWGDVSMLFASPEGPGAGRRLENLCAAHPGIPLVLVCEDDAYMGLGYSLGALHYLEKPVNESGVAEALRRALRLLGEESRYTDLVVNRRTTRVMHDEVLWLESSGKRVKIYCETDPGSPLVPYGQLQRLLAQLDDRRFFQCHRSYAVNLDAVQAVEGYEIVLSCAKRVPIKRGNKRLVQSALETHRFDKIRQG